MLHELFITHCTKDILSRDFVWHYIMYLMLHLHYVLMSCQHIMSLLISSVTSFFKKIMDRTDASLLPSHQYTEPHDSPLWRNHFNPIFDSNPDMTQRGDPQTSPKWKPNHSQIMDKEDLLEFFIVSVNLPHESLEPPPPRIILRSQF